MLAVPFEDGCVASVLVLHMFTNGFRKPCYPVYTKTAAQF